MKLVIFKDNWADEMDLEGCYIWEDAKWDRFQASNNFPDEVCFGTNEDIEYSCVEDWKSCFEAKDISEDEAHSLHRLLKDINRGFGNCPHVSHFEYLEIE